MDAEQFKMFMKHQEKAQAELIASLQKMVVKQSTTPAAGSSAGPALPLPPPLELAGDMEANFEFFKQNWKNYASAAGMDGWPDTMKKQKTSILLSVIGSAARQKYFNFELTVAETDDPELALAAIKEKVVRKRNKFVDWINFFGLSQDSDESIDDYLMKLKVLSKSCQFGALEKEMLRFKIVTSNKWPNLRTRMLGMQDLKEDAAVDMCRAEELVVTYGQVVGRTCEEVKKIRKKKECKFCGEWHEFEKGVCPAFGKRCNHCGRKNHFERVCKSDRRKRSKSKRNVHKVRDSLEDHSEESDSNESSSGSEASAVIGKIENSPELGGHVTAELDFYVDGKWQTSRCNLDTGANTSLVGYTWVTTMTGCARPKLLPSDCRLKNFSGAEIPVLGAIVVPCRREGRKYKLLLQVVNGSHIPLLSARVCKILKLVQFCDTVSESSSLSEEPVLEINRVRAFRRGGRSGETGEDHQQLIQDLPCVGCRARCWHPA
ncbi:uncharacterized protein LOC120412354 [Culex pipiens pallens]|uniref:uncharacterized protein LOC120412354 n=1 Tax=Culex pipiens pallens TaxID=42434 RepID=UPI00195464C8|nr:uncharacterized protein LOC120412354 [Culex pipiens pallens]